MRTARIPERRALDGAVLVMAMTMTTTRVRRACRAVRNGLGKGREQRMGRGKGRRQRMGRVKGTGRGTESVKGKVLLNKPLGEMVSLVPFASQLQKKMAEADLDTEG